ncbi:MAG: hypothetical protein WC955_06960 [Elusimicrobiota bacterium]
MSFKKIEGQAQAIKYLKNFVGYNRVPHALLFTGIDGIGKYRVAVEFTKILNCLAPVRELDGNMDSCGQCLPCKQIEEGVYPDFEVIERITDIEENGEGSSDDKDIESVAGNTIEVRGKKDKESIGIDQMRLLGRRAHLRAVDGKYRVFVIRGAEWLQQAAANSLLKLLEEPPLNVVIILIAQHKYSLLKTIQSRCQEVKFTRLTEDEVKRVLVYTGEIEDENINEYVRYSCGSPGLALDLFNAEFLQQRTEITAWLKQVKILSPLDIMGLTAKKYTGDRDEFRGLIKSMMLILQKDKLYNKKKTVEIEAILLSASKMVEAMVSPASVMATVLFKIQQVAEQ